MADLSNNYKSNFFTTRRYSSYKVVWWIPKLLVTAYVKMFIARNQYHYNVFTIENEIWY